MPTARRFIELMDRLGWDGDPMLAYLARREQYMEPHRSYHTWTHIAGCYALFDQHQALMDSPDSVEMALVDHDYFYDIHRDGKPVSDNELRSADGCDRFLRTGGVLERYRGPVHPNIMGTVHDGTRLTGDAAWTADIDMAIVGSLSQRYQQYSRDVEKEYRYDGLVTEKLWCVGRQMFLHKLLDRAAHGHPLFHTAQFQERFERRAGDNMRAEIEQLKRRMDYLASQSAQ